MATATKKSTPSPPPSQPGRDLPPGAPPVSPVLRAVDVVYRFLASLKLAVISLLSLAGVLAYGTFFESWYGTKAVQEWVYQSSWFLILLAFLGTNILCAALIRFPWKRRQTGFVITHAGLLVVLVGSWISLKFGDEGQVAMLEGDTTATMTRTDAPVIRVRPLDRETGTPTSEYAIPFRPGAFAWPAGRFEVLTGPQDPFKLAVKSFLPASAGKYLHEPVPAGEGVPMIRFGLAIQPPGALRPMDPFERDLQDDLRWFQAGNRFGRRSKDLGGVRLVFQHIGKEDEARVIDDFLNPPQDAATEVARLHYTDAQGTDRVYEWVIDAAARAEKQPVLLPGSDLTATFVAAMEVPDEGGVLGGQTGDQEFPIVQFRVRKGDGPELVHYGWWTPTAPTLLPTREESRGTEPLVRIGYFHPPHFDGVVRGVVEVLGTDDGRLYYRAINRAGVQGKGPLALDTPVRAFGGGPNQPMSLTFRVDQYLTSGRQRFTFVPIEMPKGQMGNGIPAALVEMTVGGETKEFWVRMSGDLKPSFEAVSFSRGNFEVGYDLDRKPLGFSFKLVDFQVGFDPGTQQPKSFESQVLLTDEARGIKERPISVSMNEPLSHRGMTFYQASYNRVTDPHTGRETGQFMSVFQVRYDPAWQIIYSGCLLVVLGIFVQFYMRAGVFTDGGKKERARAAARAPVREKAVGTGANGQAPDRPKAEAAVLADFEEL